MNSVTRINEAQPRPLPVVSPLILALCFNLLCPLGRSIAEPPAPVSGIEATHHKGDLAYSKGDYTTAMKWFEAVWASDIDLKDGEALNIQINAAHKIVMTGLRLRQLDRAREVIAELASRYQRVETVTRGMPCWLYAETEAIFLGAECDMACGKFGEAKQAFNTLRRRYLDNEDKLDRHTAARLTKPYFMVDLSRECDFGSVVAAFCRAWEAKRFAELPRLLCSRGCFPLTGPHDQPEDASRVLSRSGSVVCSNFEVQRFLSYKPFSPPVYVDVDLSLSGASPPGLDTGRYRFFLIKEAAEWRIAGIMPVGTVLPPVPPVKQGVE